MPLLSVVTATYRENPVFLRACVESVLRQTFSDFELVIVTEPGETNLGYLAEAASSDKRVKILKNEVKLGVSGSRNRAIVAGCGKYIAIVDGDDYCALNRFNKQIDFLESTPSVSVVGSNMCMVNEQGELLGVRRYPELHENIKNKFLMRSCMAAPTVMLRKKAVVEIGLFDESLAKAEDSELWLRFLAKGHKLHNLQEELMYYRMRTQHNQRHGQQHWDNIYKARKKHNKNIWPGFPGAFSLAFYFFIAHLPGGALDFVLDSFIADRIRAIKKQP